MAESLRALPEQLREIGLFGGFDDSILQVICAELPLESVPIGEKIVLEGEDAREMFVVLAGELEVLKRSRGGKDVRVAMLGPNSWFGEMSILDVQPRSASVRALAPTQLMRIRVEQVERLLYRRDLKTYALFMMNIARELSRRLRVADGLLAHILGSAEEYVTSRNTMR